MKRVLLFITLMLFTVSAGYKPGGKSTAKNSLVPTKNISTTKMYELFVEELKTTPQDEIQLTLKFINLSKDNLELPLNGTYLDVKKTVVMNGKKVQKDVTIEALGATKLSPPHPKKGSKNVVFLKKADKASVTITFKNSEASYIHAIKGGTIKIGKDKFTIPALKKEEKKTQKKKAEDNSSIQLNLKNMNSYITPNLSIYNGFECYVTSVKQGSDVHKIEISFVIKNKTASEKIFSFTGATVTGHTDSSEQLALNNIGINTVLSSFRKGDGTIGVPAGKTVKLKATFRIPVNNTKIVRISNGIINFTNPGVNTARMFCLPILDVK